MANIMRIIQKKGKIFYAQVRAYKLIDGNKFYGSWSAKKSVRVKR